MLQFENYDLFVACQNQRMFVYKISTDTRVFSVVVTVKFY